MKAYKLQKVSSYLKHYGIKKLIRKVMERKADKFDYNNERLNEIIDEKEISIQKQVSFDYEPVISIIMPAFNTPDKSLIQTLTSVKSQTYEKWELCIADGGNIPVKETVEKIFLQDNRIKYKKLEKNMGISGNSNEALALATGDYIAFLDHDDILEPDALFEVVKVISEEKADMVYTDEDKVSEDLDNYFRPYRKPDFNKSLILSNNYICHFCAISKEIINATGGFRHEFDGAQDYDLFLRCIEKANKIEHVCKVLYHWRVSTESTSDNPFNKEYAFLAGKRAIEDYLSRNGLSKVAIVKELEDPGYFRIEYTGEINHNIKVIPFDKICEEDDNNMADYYLILNDNMQISADWKKQLVGTLLLANADIAVPKQIKKSRYVYNGIAKRGKGYTQSLKGKPVWYRGKFNIGITNLDVNTAPTSGILVNAKSLKYLLTFTEGNIKDSKLKIVYAPNTVLRIKS